MKKIIVWLLCVSICVHIGASTQDEFGIFDQHLKKYDRQRVVGSSLFFGGVSFMVLGGISASVSISLLNSGIIDNDRGSTVVGYAVLGTGLVSVLLGMPLWIRSVRDYMHMLELRNRYINMIRQQ